MEKVTARIKKYLETFDLAEYGFVANKRVVEGLKKTLDNLEKINNIKKDDIEIISHHLKGAVKNLTRFCK